MQRFHIIEDAGIIMRRKGVYSQRKLYQRGSELYAGVGSTFVRILTGGTTSVPDLSWDEGKARE